MEYILKGILIITVLICLYTDLKERKIYNKVLLPALLMGILLNTLQYGVHGLINSLLGFLLGLAFLLIPFTMGGIGGGDVKLLAVIGGIMGWKFIFFTVLATGIFGGLIALIILIKQKRFFRLIKEFARGTWILFGSRFKIVSYNVDDEKYMFPYGVAISLGVAATMAVLR